MRRLCAGAVVLVIAATCTACTPVWHVYYRPEAPGGVIIETGWWKLPDTRQLPEDDGDNIEIQLVRGGRND